MWERVSGAGTVSVGFTTDGGEDEGAASEWSLGNSVQQLSGGTWSEVANSGDNPVMRMAIRGETGDKERAEITGLAVYQGGERHEIEIHWNPAHPVPTDYRIDFAPVDQDFKSWSTDEGHHYALSTATSTAIDLGNCESWKIRIRARYYKVRWENPPWSGAWATDEPVSPPCDSGAGAPAPPREPPPPNDGIVELTVDTDVGQGLWVNWTAADPIPSRYRLMWLKAGLDWSAWEESGGHSYFHDGKPVNGWPNYEEVIGIFLAENLVETGAAYNVGVRAVYDSGGSNDGPWSGPWAVVGPATVP